MATPEAWRVIEALDAVSSETGKTYAQVAIRWLMQRPGVVAPVIGVKNTEQLVRVLSLVLVPPDDPAPRPTPLSCSDCCA